MWARAAVILAHLALSACASFDAREYRTVVLPPGSTPTWHGLPVETGQVIVSEHPGASSLFLSLLASEFRPFIHAGIIVVEEGEPFVYEAFGSIRPTTGPPTVSMGGGVRRVSLDSFLRRDRIMAIHDPPAGTDRQRLAEFARAHWRERTPFDGVFDARDASRFYCVEFVARALEFASAPPTPLVSVNRNPSVGVALHWLRVDSGQLLLAGELIAQQRRAALISRSRSADEVAAYFARKAEIHRRFDEQARLGDVLSWGWQRLKLRPVIERYFAATTHDDAYALAERTFGHDAGNGLQVRAR